MKLLLLVVFLIAVLFAVSSCAPAVVTPTVNQPPVPILAVAASAHVGDAVVVDGNASVDLDGSVTDAFILFGDGSDPFVGFTTSHTWQAPGLYLVELYLTDNKGASSRARERIDVVP